MTTPEPTSIDTLRTALTGTLLLPGDDRYDEAKAPWLRIIDQYPALIVEAANTADVVLVVNYARLQELLLGVQATGHGIAKACDGGLLLKLNQMTTIDLDAPARRVKVGPGVDWKALLAQTQPHGLVGVLGQVSNVGVIGLCHAELAMQIQMRASLDVFGKPVLDQVAVLPYAAVANNDPASHKPHATTHNQTGFLRELTDEAITLLVDIGQSVFPPVAMLEILQLGGHLTTERTTPPGQAARTLTAAFMLHSVMMPEQTGWETTRQVTDDTFARLAPVLTGELYYNYMRGDQRPQVAAAFTESSFSRLQGVKRHYDPENLFRLNINIEPAAEQLWPE